MVAAIRRLLPLPLTAEDGADLAAVADLAELVGLSFFAVAVPPHRPNTIGTIGLPGSDFRPCPEPVRASVMDADAQ